MVALMQRLLLCPSQQRDIRQQRSCGCRCGGRLGIAAPAQQLLQECQAGPHWLLRRDVVPPQQRRQQPLHIELLTLGCCRCC